MFLVWRIPFFFQPRRPSAFRAPAWPRVGRAASEVPVDLPPRCRRPLAALREAHAALQLIDLPIVVHRAVADLGDSSEAWTWHMSAGQACEQEGNMYREKCTGFVS